MKKFLTPDNIRTGATALGGMIVGAIVGIAVQVGVERTGLLGPSVDALLAEQEDNFGEVHGRLDRLRQSTNDPGLGLQLEQLADMLARQDELRQQAGQELAALSGEVVMLREQSLEERGFAGGADVWLGLGESISVGDVRHVFGVTYIWQTAVDVNLNGEKKRLSPGDSMSTDSCTVFFKQAVRETDRKVGFDIACS